MNKDQDVLASVGREYATILAIIGNTLREHVPRLHHEEAMDVAALILARLGNHEPPILWTMDGE